MDFSQYFQSKKGKNKGKRSIIKTPEDFGKDFSSRGSKPDLSPEAGYREKAKKLQPSKPSACRLELNPAQLPVSLANTDESDDYDLDVPGQAGKKTLGLMKHLLGSTNAEAGDGPHLVIGDKAASITMGRGDYYSAFKKPKAAPWRKATHKHLQAPAPSTTVQQSSGGFSQEVYRALHKEENNKLKVAMVQALTEMERQQLQWQEKEAELRRAHGELQNALMEKEAALEAALDREHNLEEWLVQVTADKEEALAQARAQIGSWRDPEAEKNKLLKEAQAQAQLEIQCWRELEVHVAMQPKDSYRVGAALLQAQRGVGHWLKWQEKLSKLHGCNSNLSTTLMEGMVDPLRDLKEQLVKTTAERDTLEVEVERLTERLQRANVRHDEASHTHLSIIRELRSQLKAKEAEVATLRSAGVLEKSLQRQRGSQEVMENDKPRAQFEIQSQEDKELCLAEQIDDNNKVKTAVVEMENSLETPKQTQEGVFSSTTEIPQKGSIEKPRDQGEHRTKSNDRPANDSLWTKFFRMLK